MSIRLTESTQTPATPAAVRWGVVARRVAIVFTLVAGCWVLIGERTWRDLKEMREAEQGADDSAPIGYVGLYFRKNYGARAPRFIFQEEEKTLLFASHSDVPGQPPIFYDVTHADLEIAKLAGGVGRDSIAGVDYPILESRMGEIGRKFRSQHGMFTLVLKSGPRAYPCRILEKVDVVNDSDGDDPFVLLYDHQTGISLYYDRRIEGQTVTFGTTGYGLGPVSMVYDRASKSLWIPRAAGLTCVNGRYQGTVLAPVQTLERTTWGSWTSRYPNSQVLVGNDRTLPIPNE